MARVKSLYTWVPKTPNSPGEGWEGSPPESKRREESPKDGTPGQPDPVLESAPRSSGRGHPQKQKNERKHRRLFAFTLSLIFAGKRVRNGDVKSGPNRNICFSKRSKSRASILFLMRDQTFWPGLSWLSCSFRRGWLMRFWRGCLPFMVCMPA